MPSDPLAPLLRLEGVADAVDAARAACDELRWHPAMRRRTAQCRAEAAVHAARASAALDGARLPAALLRDALRGAGRLPDDAAGRTAAGALRASAEAGDPDGAGAGLARALRTAPKQALARLHVLAAGGLLPEEELGRPRPGGAVAARLDALADLLAGGTAAPAPVLAAVVHAEVATLPLFAAGSGVTARAAARLVVCARGLDVTGTALPEVAWLADAAGYARDLAGWDDGGPDGVAAWLRASAGAVAAGAREGRVVADAVLAGRLPAS